MTRKLAASFVCTLAIAFGAVAAPEWTGTAKLFDRGGFFVGVNYWGSKAGVHMWNEKHWDAKEIENDLAALKKTGVEVMRVFPTWPDFQPLIQNFKWARIPAGYLNELTDKPVFDPLWIEPGALERFKFFCDTAQKHNIKLLVSLVTGWMSGRLFMPRVVEGKNLITDPEAIMWEGRFARALVRTMKYHPAIVAWDLGNECNDMGKIECQAQAWNWLNTISSAIRMEDGTRPVVSGMHCMTSNGQGFAPDNNYWTLQMQGELLDLLTPHPYPAPWRVDACRGPFNAFRNALHQVSQCFFYEGISGKPAFPQEVGNFGPSVSPDWIAALGMRQELFACWQHGMCGMLWWCAFEQMHLGYPPFCNNAMERELGILRADPARTPKPVANALREFKEFKDSLPFKTLPPMRTDAVCILSERQEFYHQCYGALLLAKQAGFDVKFVGAESRKLPDSQFYIVPSGAGWETYSQAAWEGVLARVEAGATALITRGADSGYARWLETTGLETQLYREWHDIRFQLDGKTLRANDSFTAIQTPKDCTVVAKDQTGNPMLTTRKYGKGKLVVVNFDLEKASIARLPNVFEGDFSNELWRIYAFAAREAGVRRLVTRSDPRLVVTEHHKADGTTIVCALNTRDTDVTVPITVAEGKVGTVWNGSYADGKLSIRRNDGCIFEVK